MCALRYRLKHFGWIPPDNVFKGRLFNNNLKPRIITRKMFNFLTNAYNTVRLLTHVLRKPEELSEGITAFISLSQT